MKPNPYAGRSLWAFDTETWLIMPGLLAPPLVCGSWATAQGEGILDKGSTRSQFRGKLNGPQVLVGHNLAYDLGVMCADDPSLVPLVFDKLERGEAYDTMIAEQLILIHEGTLGEGHSSSGSGFSLDELGQKYLGIDRAAEKSGPDAWRLRYAELDGVPLSEWPEAAKAYPIRDARFTYDIAALQIQDGRNLHDLPAQVRAHWALHLMSMWGVRTDAPWVADFTVKVTAEHTRSRAKYLAAGLLKVKRCVNKKDKETQVSTLEPADDIDRDALEQAIALKAGTPAAAELTRALADVDAGRPMRYGLDKKALEAAVIAAYGGEPPRGAPTDAMKKKAAELGVPAVGNIKTSKDALKESQNDLLREFAEDQDNEKFFSTYLKVLAQGTVVPINCRYSPLVDTGRASCSRPNMMNLPRGSKAGKPREAFIARPGTVWSSNDYPTLELRTLAFACEALGLESEMAKALRDDKELHEFLGAQILSVALDEFKAWKKMKDTPEAGKYKNGRQMAKPTNFGLPGGLGATKLVTFARDSYKMRFCLEAGVATTCGVEKYKDKRAKVTVCAACRQVAVELKDTWFAAYPEMETYFELVMGWTSKETVFVETVDEDGEVDFGLVSIGSVTQLVSERVRGRCTFTNGANTIFQGLGADVAKRALWLVSKECYTDPASPLWGSHPVVFVHDEIITEHPEGKAHAAAFRVAALMNQAFLEFCGPQTWKDEDGTTRELAGIPCDVRPALMRRWQKEAEETYIDDPSAPVVQGAPKGKRLIPYEDRVV